VLPWKDSDDEVVVNVAIRSLRESLLAWLKTERGVHIETLLCSIGALAGGRSEDRAAGMPAPPNSATEPPAAPPAKS
jgi:hypothetical protein